jgi:hypothetical protein
VYRRTGSSDAYEYVIAGGYNVSGGRYGIAVDDAGGGSTDNKFYLTDGAASYHTNTVCAYNTWYHVVLTWAGTEMKFYVNGSLDSTFTVASCNFQSSGNGHKIGEYFYNGTYEWSGEIDQVRIFNTALSASDVTALARGAGTANNGAASNVTWLNGRFSQAAVFNGSSSYINLPNLGTDMSGSNTRTLSAWVKLDSNPSVYSAVVSYGAAASLQSFGLYISSTGTPRVSYYNINYDTSTTLTLGNWHHIVGIYKGGNVQTTANTELYIDGQIQTLTATNSLNLTGPINTSNTNYAIGYYRASPSGSYFNGDIDQVRIFSIDLTGSQVTELYEEHYQTKFTDGSDTAIVFTEGTGTVTFSGVDPAPPQGALRANTSYSEDGSASVIEHYNGTDWKYFDAIKYCTTNTLNFPLGAGCIASYNLDNNVNDIGNTYNGVNSNVTFNASGKFGAAAVFNGSSSYISNVVNIGVGNSLSVWFQPNADTVSLYTNYDGTYDFFTINIEYDGTSQYRVRIFLRNNVSTYYYVTTDYFTLSDQWHHFALNINSFTNYKVYIDGSEVTFTGTQSSGTPTTHPTSNNRAFGRAYTNGVINYSNVKLDQYRVFNTALTSDEVLELYNNEIACS